MNITIEENFRAGYFRTFEASDFMSGFFQYRMLQYPFLLIWFLAIFIDSYNLQKVSQE